MQSHRERIGKRIRLARKSAGLSHDQLAAKVGSSRSHLIKLEKGMHAPGDSLAKKIAEATGRTVEYLAGEGPDDEDEDEESDPVAALTFAIKRLVQAEVRAL